jgi:hypothetical protein
VPSTFADPALWSFMKTIESAEAGAAAARVARQARTWVRMVRASAPLQAPASGDRRVGGRAMIAA